MSTLRDMHQKERTKRSKTCQMTRVKSNGINWERYEQRKNRGFSIGQHQCHWPRLSGRGNTELQWTWLIPQLPAGDKSIVGYYTVLEKIKVWRRNGRVIWTESRKWTKEDSLGTMNVSTLGGSLHGKMGRTCTEGWKWNIFTRGFMGNASNGRGLEKRKGFTETKTIWGTTYMNPGHSTLKSFCGSG